MALFSGGLPVMETGCAGSSGDWLTPARAEESGTAAVAGETRSAALSVSILVTDGASGGGELLSPGIMASLNLWVIACCFMLPWRTCQVEFRCNIYKRRVDLRLSESSQLRKSNVSSLVYVFTFVVNPFPHASHLKGLSFVWERM